MNGSIRYRLFVGISLFVVVIIGLIWILNIGYLDDYYLFKKKEILKDYGERIDKFYSDNSYDENKELENIEEKLGFGIIVFNKSLDIEYFSNNIEGRGRGAGINNPLIPSISSRALSGVFAGKVVFETNKHPKIGTEFLVMGYKLSNENILLLQTPLASIKEGVGVAKDFYLYIGVLALMIGIIMSFVFSKYFTLPIIELNNVTRAMAKLDFSKKSEIKNKDEIGQLGKNINSLSAKLDETITSLNLANSKLKDDILKEREIDEMRKEFISSVSHELKTPIALIQGYTEGLKDNVIEDVESKNYYLDVIIDECKRMDKLVKDLLNLSKIEYGKFQLEKEDFNLSKMVNDTIDKYNKTFKENNIVIKKVIEPNLMVNADRDRIEQVLVNFINNGLNNLDHNKTMEFKVNKEDEGIKVSVFNSGKNIPENEIDKLWISFYKLDRSRNRDDGGTGLGLSIVKGIIELHKGSYGASNKRDGVEFWFKLNGKNN